MTLGFCFRLACWSRSWSCSCGCSGIGIGLGFGLGFGWSCIAVVVAAAFVVVVVVCCIFVFFLLLELLDVNNGHTPVRASRVAVEQSAFLGTATADLEKGKGGTGTSR